MFGNKWALLVGTGDYSRVPKLKFAAKDALELRQVLHDRLGFPQQNVIVLSELANLKPDRSELFNQLGRMRDQGVGSDDLLFFYFSGHGVYDEKSKEDYLLPIDAAPFNLTYTGIGVTDVVDQLQATGCHNIVMFIDACREELQEGGKGISSLGTGSKSTVNRSGMASFFSCDPRSRSFEIDDLEHGSFTYCLLDAIKNSQTKTVAELNTYLVTNVPLLNDRYKKPPQQPYLILNPEDIGRLPIFEGISSPTPVIEDSRPLLEKLTTLFNQGDLEALYYADAVTFLEQTRETQVEQAKYGLIINLCSENLPANKFMAAWRTLTRANLGPRPIQGPGTFTR